MHSTRSGKFTREEEYQKTVDYMMKPLTVSSHRVIGVLPGQHAQLVEDDLIAHHAEEDNLLWLGIELAQPLPGDPYSDFQYEESAAVVRLWHEKYRFPLDRLWIRGHQETAQGRRWGKSDPGDKADGGHWDWERFIGLVLS